MSIAIVPWALAKGDEENVAIPSSLKTHVSKVDSNEQTAEKLARIQRTLEEHVDPKHNFTVPLLDSYATRGKLLKPEHIKRNVLSSNIESEDLIGKDNEENPFEDTDVFVLLMPYEGVPL